MHKAITRKDDYIHVDVTGTFLLSEANECSVSIFEALAEHGVHRVLVDCRKLEGEPTTMERFVLATFAALEFSKFAESGVPRGTRFSYVGHEPLVDKRRFGETVATNRGLTVRVFTDYQQAIEWLSGD